MTSSLLSWNSWRQNITRPRRDDRTGRPYGSIGLSPDGNTLAFVSERSGKREIWTMPVTGGPARQLTTDELPKFWPRWSPDGQKIAFHAGDSNSNLNLWIVPARGGEAKQITNVQEVYYPLWWRDGQSLVSTSTVGHWALWRFPVSGGDPVPLTGADFNGEPNDLRWSSDNSQIYFIGPIGGPCNIWSRSVADGAVRQLTDFSGRYGELSRSFSTDGTYLYFAWLEHTSDLWVMDVEQEE